MDELVAKALNAGKVDKTKADYQEGYLGGGVLSRAPQSPYAGGPPCVICSTTSRGIDEWNS